MMIGKDRSYRRVVPRSVIPPILQFTPRIFALPRVPFFELNLQTMDPACRPGWLSNRCLACSFATQLIAGFVRDKVTQFSENALSFSLYVDEVTYLQVPIALS